MASPMAVRSPSWMPSMACLTATRSVVGVTRIWAAPLKVTRPTLIFGGSRSTNDLAASLAAWMRLGVTSSASIDSDVSMARMIVARSRGTLTSRGGRGHRGDQAGDGQQEEHGGERGAASRAARGATESSSSRLVKRTA